MEIQGNRMLARAFAATEFDHEYRELEQAIDAYVRIAALDHA